MFPCAVCVLLPCQQVTGLPSWQSKHVPHGDIRTEGTNWALGHSSQQCSDSFAPGCVQDTIKNLFPKYSSKTDFWRFFAVNMAAGGLAGGSPMS